MKPIHFRPNPDATARSEAAQKAYAANQGPGVAAVVRSATSTDQTVGIQHKRRVQLDDYVAKIRQSAKEICPTDSSRTERPEVIFKTRIQDQNESSDRDSTFETVHKAESLPQNAEVIQQFNDALHQLRAPHVPAEQFSQEDYQTEEHRRLDAAYQRQLIDEIGVAIASEVTNVPDDQIKEKLPPLQTEIATEPAAESKTEPVADPTAETSNDSQDVPAEVAAWDVDDFRWPTLSNQMIATASDAMQELFDQVLNVCQEDETRPSNRLAVTGAGRGEGTSTIAISIARWAAACGKSVLLIDADLASPSLTTQVGLQHGLSWLKAVERNDDPSEVIIRSQRTELCVMPLAPIEARSNYPRCLFDSLGPFLGKVESHFDWVVIDFGPGSQLLAELSRPELLIDSALLIGADTEVNGLDSLQRRLQNLGLERFVLAQNSVRQQEAA
jgi:Mrp family chromosome partitioning ATPase